MRWDSVLAEVLGDESGVTGVTLNSTTGNKISQLDVHGVFIAIGHDPNTAIINIQLDMEGGYNLVRGRLTGIATETSVPGVFAAGGGLIFRLFLFLFAHEGGLKGADAFAHGCADLGQAFGAEYQENHDDDNRQFRYPKWPNSHVYSSR